MRQVKRVLVARFTYYTDKLIREDLVYVCTGGGATLMLLSQPAGEGTEVCVVWG